jgi:hypothetical protein
MSRLAVVAPIKWGSFREAKRLIEKGPPFDPELTQLDRHEVFLTDTEVVFVFEAPGAREALESLFTDVSFWSEAEDWRRHLAGRPRLADDLYHWERAGNGVQSGP